MDKPSRIITESTADLPSKLITKYHIRMIPMSVAFGGETFLDGITLTPQDLYTKMRAEKASPKTAQVTPAQYMKVFRETLDSGETPVHIGFSSKLSGSYQSSVLAASSFEPGQIYTLDTNAASLGEGLLVLEAAKMAQAGVKPQEIIKTVDRKAKTLEHIVLVDTLEYLARGGRVSPAKAFIGNVLNMKPLLHMVDGALIPFETARTRKKALKRIVELMEARGTGLSEQTIGISHADNEETALELRDMIKERFGSSDFILSTIGATIGAHAGPGTVAIFFYGHRQGGPTA